MPKIKPQDTAWLPPAFPLNGRLPDHPYPVAMNERRQNSLEQRYYDECCLAAGKRVWRPCCKTLHVSLFFDGTGNNLHNDVYVDEHPHPSNIARLFRAAIGSGHAGGAALENALLDVPPAGSETYFKFYMPGVGTPFPEIGELDYSNLGLATASGGENRINWGLLRLIDALMRALKLGKLEDTASLAAVGDMATSWAALGLGGAHNRYETFYRHFNRLQNNIWQAMNPTGRGKARLMGMKLYVYGFSRGAAQARTFVNWLTELFPKPDSADGVPAQVLQGSNPACRLPVSVEFLGLLDTVASVGVANIAPFAAGHMAWADGTQALPDDARFGGLVKQCVHLVASHEQRLCFPLDSLRRGNGQYPRNSVEVVYPGMHSDIGGGYPPGDQGKGRGDNDGFLLSQIALHELYATAFAAGAPLKVPEEALPRHLALDSWRILTDERMPEFALAPDVIHRFNAWREATLGLSSSAQPAAEETDNGHYQPGRAGLALEALIANQMAWLTAWRIDRYARGSALNCAFYRAATDSHANAGSRKAAEAARDERQKSAERARLDLIADYPNPRDRPPLPPGPKDFDPDLAQTQLRQAMEEFGNDYRSEFRLHTSVTQLVLDTLPRHAIYLLNLEDEAQEFDDMKKAGDGLTARLFPPQGEASNAQTPVGLLRALFDDQVHDSRAWFMHSTFGSREPWGGYFRYRMIYFADDTNKSVSPLTVAGDVIGAATVVSGVVFTLRRKKLGDKLLGIAGTAGALKLEAIAGDILSGKALPMRPEADELRAFTREPGTVIRGQQKVAQEKRLAYAQERAAAVWAAHGIAPLVRNPRQG